MGVSGRVDIPTALSGMYTAGYYLVFQSVAKDLILTHEDIIIPF